MQVGVAVGVAADAEPQPVLDSDDESSDWLAPRLKAHFDLEDAAAEAAIAVVTGRPNFLKTTRMLRARRTRHPTQWEALARRIAEVFAVSEDVDATAASVEKL